MKSNCSFFPTIGARNLPLILTFCFAVLIVRPVHAATLSWTSTGTSTPGGNGTWDTSSALWWTGSVAQAWTTNTTTGDTAVFDGTAGTVTLGANINALGLTFNSTGYTIGLNGNTLALGTSGINATPLTSGTTSISGAGGVGLAGSQTWDVGSGATLAISSGISSSNAGSKILTVQGAGDTTSSGGITAGSGWVNLNKRGTGTLTLSGGAAIGYATNGNGISNGGSTSHSAVLLGGTTNVSSGAYTSANEFVVGGVLTNGGAGVNTNLTMDGGSLTIGSGTGTGGKYLSLGRGNGIGVVSSDIVLNNSASITTDNFSAGFNGGNAGNLPKGTFTLNGTSSFSIATNGNFFLGESAGSNMTMTLNNTSTVNAGSGVIAIGVQSGNGTLNVNTGATFNSGGEIRVAYSGANGTFSGTGTINVNGGTVNTNALTVGRNNNDVTSTMTGTVNVTAGAVNVKNSTTLIGWRGIGTTATLNVSGGSFNQGTTAATNMSIGSFNGANGAVNVSGTGALTLQNNSNLRFSDTANGNAIRTLTISGGNLTFYSDAGSTVGGTGTIDLMNTSNPTGVNTIHLNGGTLTVNQIKATSATGTRVINFNGGTLKAGGSGFASTFLAGGVATRANIRNGGATIHTNGNNITIGQALLHSDIGGDNATDGGLTKIGSGTLALMGANSYNGNTFVDDGAFTLGNAGSMLLMVSNGTSTRILGDATNAAATFDGQFKLDLSAVTVSNGSWSLVDVGNLNESFSGTFSLVDNAAVLTFTQASDVWTAVDGSKTWTFTEGTGVLQVVPEPNPVVMLLGGLGMCLLLRRRRW